MRINEEKEELINENANPEENVACDKNKSGDEAAEAVNEEITEAGKKADAGDENEGENAFTGEDDKSGEERVQGRRQEKKLIKEIRDKENRIKELEAALKAGEDKYLRLAAEYDNFRRRSIKEKECIYTDAFADAAALLLPIMDNLERAGEFAETEEMKKGLEIIYSSAREALSKMGIAEIECVGKPFDPNFHNAVMHSEDVSLPENTITKVFQKGYVLGDRVLRCAMVQVVN